MSRLLFFPAVLVIISLGGCGLTVPSMQSFGGDRENEEADENVIINHIKCEIHEGVYATLNDPRFNPRTSATGKPVDWLKAWGAKVSYVITADEKGSFNPGLSYKNPFAKMATFASLSGGLQTSTEAQRKETGAVTYAFSDLLKEGLPSHCSDEQGILIHSNLRIAEFISNKVFLTRVPGTVPGVPATLDASKPQVLNAFSDEITFTVIYGGSATPSWSFVRLSVDPVSPLVSATRSKIQYVTITLGPVEKSSSPTKAAQLTEEAQAIDNANLIGHAVASALRGLIISPTP